MRLLLEGTWIGDEMAGIVTMIVDGVEGGWVELGKGLVGVLAVEALLVAIDPGKEKVSRVEVSSRP